MAAGEIWDQSEIDLTVAAYLRMLALELQASSYNKADFRRGLLPLLKGRTEGSIELKHQNISAVMIGFNLPYINGYKPRYNYQRALAETVKQQVGLVKKTLSPLLERVAETTYTQLQGLLIHEAPPEVPYAPMGVSVSRPQVIDFAQREAENRALGRAGEELVFEAEKERLATARRDDLVGKVRWVSRDDGDGAGFDILSFDEQTDRERLIEVKTTTQGKYFPFYATRNEVKVSQERSDAYELHRLFKFSDGPRLYMLKGSLSKSCQLDATVYEARPGRQVSSPEQ